MVAFAIVEMESDLENHLALFKKDPEAWILECIRLHGGGGGGPVWRIEEDKTYTLGSGAQVTERKGSIGTTITYMANQDPNVWGGPSKDPVYARKFVMHRGNINQMMSWMNEIGDIRKCPNMTGCPAAPRFCPAAEFSQRIGRQLLQLWIDKCVATKGKQKDEM